MRNDRSPTVIYTWKRKLWHWCALGVIILANSSGPVGAANVTINAGNELSTVGDAAFGLHTSVYDNQNGNANLPSRLIQSGVNTLRYSGGGYADIFHWSVSKSTLGSGNGYGMTPWWGQTNNYGYMGSQTDFGNFVKLLSNAQCQAVITVDFGSGQQWDATHSKLIVPATNASPQEAAAWVAYANANTNIYGTTNDVAIGLDTLGNDWKTSGFWAMLRAASPLGIDDGYNFLRINHPVAIGIKYWEIGNETFGTGYYGGGNGYSVNYAVPYPYTTFSRSGNPLLSPTAYGQAVAAFSQMMKAVDPTIRIGAVVSTPPGDYSWDAFHNQRWTPQVLAQCANNIDFVIAHWYPNAGNLDSGSTLLPQVGGTIPFMINGATAGQDAGTNSGLRDWINAYRADGTNVQIFITEFNYNGSVTNSLGGTPVLGPVNALFAADCYSTWLSYGVANVDYLEMNKTSFLGDSSSLTRGEVYFAMQMLRHLVNVGDAFVGASSDTANLRTQAVFRQDGNLGILLINENRTSSQTVNVTVNNVSLSSSGTAYQFGTANFSGSGEIPVSGPTTNSASGFGNSFSINVPAYTMMVLVVPTLAPNTPPTLAPIANQTVNAGQTVAFTASATDTDQPPQDLTFNLLIAPTNATLDADSGDFSWRPLVSEADTTNLITLEVTDSGNPNLSATQSFAVTVNPLVETMVSPAGWSNGQFALQVSGQTGPDYAVWGSTNLTDWNRLFTTNSPAMPFEWVDTNTAALPIRFYRIEIGPPLQ
jgi:hypothetical protein